MKLNHAPAHMLVFLLSGILSCSYAETAGVKLSGDPQQRLIIENLNLSGAAFFSAYMSKDIHQRQLAEMYLAGVLDAGEGRLWCGYGVALPGSLQELVYLGLKKQSDKSLSRRASDVVNEILASKLPCGKAK